MISRLPVLREQAKPCVARFSAGETHKQEDIPQEPREVAGSFLLCLARPGLVSRLSVPKGRASRQRA